MGTRVELTEGAWAEFDEPRRVSARKRRTILEARLAISKPTLDKSIEAAEAARGADTEAARAAAAEVGKTASPEDVTAMLGIYDAAIVALISAWSYDAPVTTDALLDIPGEDYSLLQTAAEPFVEELQVDFGPQPDQQSPTPPSSV